MKIDRSSGTLPTVNLGSSAPVGKSTDASATVKTAAAQVQISAQVLNMVAPASAESSSFDSKKVEDIKAAIASGQFQVNAESVADGLLSSVNELVRAQPRGRA